MVTVQQWSLEIDELINALSLVDFRTFQVFSGRIDYRQIDFIVYNLNDISSII